MSYALFNCFHAGDGFISERMFCGPAPVVVFNIRCTMRFICPSRGYDARAAWYRPLQVIGSLMLHYQQVEWLGVCNAKNGENRVSLTPMMRLMVEKMSKYLGEGLPMWDTFQGLVVAHFLEIRLGNPVRELDNAFVFFLPCSS